MSLYVSMDLMNGLGGLVVSMDWAACVFQLTSEDGIFGCSTSLGQGSNRNSHVFV